MKDIDNQSFLNRLQDFINQKKLNIAEFERLCGLNRNVIDSAFRNKGTIGNDKLSKIYTTFPDLNLDWLLTGEGSMLLSEENFSYVKLSESKLPVPPERQFSFPLSGQAAQAGIVVGYSDWEQEDYIIQCNLPAYRSSNVRAFSVRGESMQPTIMNGEMVVCMRILSVDLHNFKKFTPEIYVVVCEDGILVKRVVQEKNGFTLISDNNQTFLPSFIPLEKILEIWKVDGAYRKVF